MPTATFRGPATRLRINPTGTRLVRGQETQVTHHEAAILAESGKDVLLDGVVNFDTLDGDELRAMCRHAGLPVAGSKSELVERLQPTV